MTVIESGLIQVQRSSDYQCVVFTLVGEITVDQRDYWNQAVANLEAKLPNVIGVTLVRTGAAANLPQPADLPKP
jgi:hypothetical protein